MVLLFLYNIGGMKGVYMLLSFAYLLLGGLLLGMFARKIHIPALVGMLIAGILLGPSGWNILDDELLQISVELRQVALIIILMRAGLSLHMKDLKQIGRPAIRMCFIPATLEIVGTLIFAPLLFNVSWLDAMLIATVLAAVSPAVIVPTMLKLISERYGTEKKIPQLILAGASVDDVYVIVLFTSFLGLAASGVLQATDFIRIPTSMIFGVLVGGMLGLMGVWFFKRFSTSDSVKVIILLAVSFILLAVEHALNGMIGFSGLLAIMSIGIVIQTKLGLLSQRLGEKFSKLWVAAEIILFVLVGASVNVSYALKEGWTVLILLGAVLLFRMVGVLISLVGTSLNQKERLFCMIAYTPKATVQAAIGAIPLSMGLAAGHTILTIAVVSILVTAPVGSFMMEHTYRKWLQKQE